MSQVAVMKRMKKYDNISTQKQKNDLENQKKILRKYCSATSDNKIK